MNSVLSVKDIEIHDIEVSTDRVRCVHEADVLRLMADIQEKGLDHPISVNKKTFTGDTQPYVLIAGAHRLEAVRRLNKGFISCTVLNVSKDTARAYEIEENFLRKDYNIFETVRAFEARKVLYEAQYPETKHGGKRENAGRGKNQESHNETLEKAPPFIEYAVERLGLSKPTIYRYKAVVGDIPRVIADRLISHSVARSYTELERLSKQEPQMQERIAGLLTSGKCDSVSEALKTLNPKASERSPDDVNFDRIQATWDKSTDQAKVATLTWLSGAALPDGWRVVRDV